MVTFLYYIIGFITIYFVTKYFNFVYNFIVLFYYKNFNILVIYIIKEDIKKVDEYVVTPYKIGSNTINKEDDINDIAIEIPQNREEIINLEPIKNNLRIALLSQNTTTTNTETKIWWKKNYKKKKMVKRKTNRRKK